MPLIGARLWFAATAGCALAGVVISAITAANDAHERSHPAAARAVNAFVFFTIQSHLLVGAAAVLLVLKLNRSSTAVAVLRLSSLVAIPVTGLVFHAVLARRWTSRAGMRSARRVALADPPHLLARLTLIRGAIAHWYPYPFIDVTQLRYAAPPSTACGWLCCFSSDGARNSNATVVSLARPGAHWASASGTAGSPRDV